MGNEKKCQNKAEKVLEPQYHSIQTSNKLNAKEMYSLVECINLCTSVSSLLQQTPFSLSRINIQAQVMTYFTSIRYFKGNKQGPILHPSYAQLAFTCGLYDTHSSGGQWGILQMGSARNNSLAALVYSFATPFISHTESNLEVNWDFEQSELTNILRLFWGWNIDPVYRMKYCVNFLCSSLIHWFCLKIFSKMQAEKWC